MTKKEKQILQDELEENYEALYYYQFCFEENKDALMKQWAQDVATRVASLRNLMYKLSLHTQIAEASNQAFKNAKYAFENKGGTTK